MAPRHRPTAIESPAPPKSFAPSSVPMKRPQTFRAPTSRTSGSCSSAFAAKRRTLGMRGIGRCCRCGSSRQSNFAQKGQMAKDVDRCSAKARHVAFATHDLALSSLWRGVPIRGRVGDSRRAAHRAPRIHSISGPSAARTSASGAVVSRRDFSKCSRFLRGAREHGEEGPLARVARQGVKVDSLKGEPSRLERLRLGL